MLVPPAGYFERLQALFDRHDILLIVDEVITGFGRLGTWFATEFYKLKPDIVSLAKGITSAYFPMSASLISQRVWDVMERASPEVGPVMHGFTYSGHPVGAAMALANLAILEDEGMVANSASMGAYLKKGLKERVGDHPYVGDVRGEGLMIAVELSADKGKRVAFPSRCRERIDLWPTRRSRLASSCDLRRSSRRSLSRRRSASRRTSVTGRSICSLTRSRRRRRSSMRWPSRGRPPEARAQVELVSVGLLMDVLLGVDVGGTFTDFVAYDPESRGINVWKVPSVPGDPVAGILDGISQELPPEAIRLLRLGTTVATNAILERKGATVAYVTTRGFRDVPFIQRGNRKFHYDMSWVKPKPLVKRRHCFEITERIDAAGKVVTPLSESDLAEVAEAIRSHAGDQGGRRVLPLFLPQPGA